MTSLLALGAKALSMAIAFVCGVLSTRLILGDAGIEHYALYSLLTVLPSLLAFTDLGAGAVIVNGVAQSDDPANDAHLTAQVTTVGRILLGFSAALLALNATMLATGAWRLVLGDAGALPHAPLAAFACITVFCCGVPIGIWVRVMLGLRRNHVIILVQALISPLTLLGIWIALHSPSSSDAFLALASYGASFLVSALGLSLTWRATRPLLPRAAHMLLHPARHPGVRVMDVGWPMLAQLVTYPIAVSSQRYVLAAIAPATVVAEYGVVGQVFLALNGLVIAAGVALWPLVAHRRHRGELRRGPWRMTFGFAAGILAATAIIEAARAPLFAFTTDATIEPSTWTVLAFGLMVAAAAAVYPLGMFIMDTPGIRFQVVPTLAMAATSLALAIVLAPSLGASGPPLGTAIAITACQIVPFAIYIARHRERLMARG